MPGLLVELVELMAGLFSSATSWRHIAQNLTFGLVGKFPRPDIPGSGGNALQAASSDPSGDLAPLQGRARHALCSQQNSLGPLLPCTRDRLADVAALGVLSCSFLLEKPPGFIRYWVHLTRMKSAFDFIDFKDFIFEVICTYPTRGSNS